MKWCGKCRQPATHVLTVHLPLEQCVKQNLCQRCAGEAVRALVQRATHHGLEVEPLNAYP